MKKEIQDSDLGLDFINQLRPVSYKWKSGDQDIHYGLLAQETEKVVNESRGQNPDENTPIVDYDKKVDRYGIKYSELIAPLIKSVQELYGKVKLLVDAKVDRIELASKADKTEVEQLKRDNAAKDKKIEAMGKALCRLGESEFCD